MEDYFLELIVQKKKNTLKIFFRGHVVENKAKQALVLSEAAGADEQLSASGCVLSEEALLQRLSDGWKQARHREDQARNWASAVS